MAAQPTLAAMRAREQTEIAAELALRSLARRNGWKARKPHVFKVAGDWFCHGRLRTWYDRPHAQIEFVVKPLAADPVLWAATYPELIREPLSYRIEGSMSYRPPPASILPCEEWLGEPDRLAEIALAWLDQQTAQHSALTGQQYCAGLEADDDPWLLAVAHATAGTWERALHFAQAVQQPAAYCVIGGVQKSDAEWLADWIVKQASSA